MRIIFLQEYIEGYEVSVPVLERDGHYISTPPVWVKFEGDILDYNKVDGVQYSFSVIPNEEFPYNDVIPSICKHAEHVPIRLKHYWAIVKACMKLLLARAFANLPNN